MSDAGSEPTSELSRVPLVRARVITCVLVAVACARSDAANRDQGVTDPGAGTHLGAGAYLTHTQRTALTAAQWVAASGVTTRY